MAKSNAERQKAYRERRKLSKKSTGSGMVPDPSANDGVKADSSSAPSLDLQAPKELQEEFWRRMMSQSALDPEDFARRARRYK